LRDGSLLRVRATDRLPHRRRRVATAILAVGLLGSVAIYWNAAPAPGNPLGYDPEDTKQYLRQMQEYGGNANVLASELRLWLASLWHGQRLAFTVAFLTLLTAAAYWLFTRPALEDEAEGPAGH
jgi:hypothetical protein